MFDNIYYLKRLCKKYILNLNSILQNDRQNKGPSLYFPFKVEQALLVLYR